MQFILLVRKHLSSVHVVRLSDSFHSELLILDQLLAGIAKDGCDLLLEPQVTFVVGPGVDRWERITERLFERLVGICLSHCLGRWLDLVLKLGDAEIGLVYWILLFVLNNTKQIGANR